MFVESQSESQSQQQLPSPLPSPPSSPISSLSSSSIDEDDDNLEKLPTTLPSPPQLLSLSTSPSNNNLSISCCCMICYERYQIQGRYEPKVLTCGHTLCFNCLSSLYASNLIKCCPFCKSDLQLHHPNLFPKNFSLIQILLDQFRNHEDANISQVNHLSRLTLAKMHCDYDRALLEQSRKELIEYHRLRTLAQTQLREIDRLSNHSFQRFYETHERLERNIAIMTLLHSTREREQFPINSQHHPSTYSQQIIYVPATRSSQRVYHPSQRHYHSHYEQRSPPIHDSRRPPPPPSYRHPHAMNGYHPHSNQRYQDTSLYSEM